MKSTVVWRIGDNKTTLFWRAWSRFADQSGMFKEWNGDSPVEHPRIYYDRAEAERFMRPICESRKAASEELKITRTPHATFFFCGEDPDSAYVGHGHVYGILHREELIGFPSNETN